METSLLERIGRMEAALNLWNELGAEAEDLLSRMEGTLPQLKQLIDYYSSSQWFADLEAYDQGALPEGTPAGVLSEDGVFDLLTELYSHMERVRQIERSLEPVPSNNEVRAADA